VFRYELIRVVNARRVYDVVDNIYCSQTVWSVLLININLSLTL